MDKGNVLVIGNSGVGKSELINAVLGEQKARTGYGTSGTTEKLEVYENEKVPFRMIDTIGFEPSALKEINAINAVRKWSKESLKDSLKDGDDDSLINVIWYCVDGTSRKLFPEAIRNFVKATAMWPSVPVIVVITKSYSMLDREENIRMVNEVFDDKRLNAQRPRLILPVVAATYALNETAYAAPEGITELIDATNALMPEGKKASENDLASFKLSRKRALSHSIVGVATAAAVVVGAVPIPIADALILTPVEIALVNALARIYGVNKNEESKRFLNSIVEVGTVSVVARGAISMLKAIPGLNIGAGVLNAVMAGSIVAALGEGAVYAFEQIYLGQKSIADIDWVKKLMEAALSNKFIEKTTAAIGKISDKSDNNTIAGVIGDLFFNSDKEE